MVPSFEATDTRYHRLMVWVSLVVMLGAIALGITAGALPRDWTTLTVCAFVAIDCAITAASWQLRIRRAKASDAYRADAYAQAYGEDPAPLDV